MTIYSYNLIVFYLYHINTNFKLPKQLKIFEKMMLRETQVTDENS